MRAIHFIATGSGLMLLLLCGCKAVPASRVKAVAAGQEFACALLVDGTVECWGADDHGQLGRGRTRPPPVDAATDSSLEGGPGPRDSGAPSDAAVGDGATADAAAEASVINLPRRVVGLTDVQSIVAGASFACALLSDSTVACWGQNNFGQLGDGGAGGDSAVPRLVRHVSGAVSLTAGEGHACATLESGEFKCWGRNDWGQLGDPSANALLRVSSMAAGALHTCALLTSQSVLCWGDNRAHELGAPGGAPLDASDGATQIAAGGTYTCALRVSGKVTCWGNLDPSCRIGCGSDASDVQLMGAAKALSVGPSHPCALLHDGSVECWGKSGVPVPVPGIAAAQALDVGPDFGCAVMANGNVECWGSNTRGQLGDGSLQSSSRPVQVKL